ncbi:MAG: hypothetical protein PHQ50_07455, partial [Eubacteriales bacterium]|nr:hypothetical protein [Eubacteriales bacterium]
MKKRFQPSKKTISILLTILLMVTALPTPVLAAPAATPAEAVSATISSYYTEEKEATLEDWEELAALAAAGEDLSKYKLPETPASGST